MRKIAVVNTLSVPSGQASVNRILSFTKGLVECGDFVDILTSGTPLNGRIENSIDGVRIYSYGKSKSAPSLFIALICILKKIKNEKYDVVISTTNSLLLIYPLFLICKLTHAKFVQEKSEFPFVLMKQGFMRKLWAKFYVNTTYKLMDGIIVMTHPLLNYFKTKSRKNCKFIEMPMTVDSSRFDIEKQDDKEFGNYIAYCGDMSGNKDGVANLIDAFSLVESEKDDITLLLIGGTTIPDEFEKLKHLVFDKSLKHVKFYGRAERTQIPQLLKNAKVLALARPSSLQSSGGFPTKLGEYLSTGNPVVVTAVGDIPLYLNKENAFVVKPDDNIAFGKTLLAVLNDYETAKTIGKKGKEIAETTFNYRVQSKHLHDFLNEEL